MTDVAQRPARTIQARLSPIAAFVRGLAGEYYLLSEVASALDVPIPTLRRLKREDPDRWGPSASTYYGDRLIRLYTPEDLTRLAVRFAEIRRTTPAMLTGALGRPRMWSRAESADRQRRFSQASYAAARAKLLRPSDPAAARAAYNRSRLLIRDLRAEASARRAELATRM